MPKLFQNDKEIYLSREHTDCLKGLLAVVVIFSHIRGQLTVPIPMFPFSASPWALCGA